MSENGGSLNLVLRRNELEMALAHAVAGSVDAGWQSLKFEALAAGNVTESLIHVERDGEATTKNASNDTFAMIKELRKLMYRPGYGTWFSLEMNLDNQGHLEANYNYDDEADWSFELADQSYRRDQRKFPRDPEHVPAWLASKLGLGDA